MNPIITKIKNAYLIIIYIISFTSISITIMIFTTLSSRAQNINNSIYDIISQLQRGNVKTVAVLNFVDVRGRVRALGKYLAEELSITLVKSQDTIKVIDRGNLNRLLDELNLSESGLINPENAKKLSNISGIDALIFGSIVPTGDSYRLQLRGISVGTAEVIAAAGLDIRGAEHLKALWRDIVSLNNSYAIKSKDGSMAAESGISRNDNVKYNERLQVNLINLSRSQKIVYGQKFYSLNSTFSVKNLENKPVEIIFVNKYYLMYQDLSGLTCSPTSDWGRIETNLGKASSASAFGYGKGQMIGPGEEFMVVVKSLNCPAPAKQGKGNFSIKMLSKNESNRTFQESFNFRDIELTGTH